MFLFTKMPFDRPYLNLIEEFDPQGNHLRGKAIEHIYLSAISADPLHRVDHLRRAIAYTKAAIDCENRRQIREKALGDWCGNAGKEDGDRSTLSG